MIYLNVWGGQASHWEIDWISYPLPDTFDWVGEMSGDVFSIAEADTVYLWYSGVPEGIGGLQWFACDSTWVVAPPQYQFDEMSIDLQIDTMVQVDPTTWGNLKTRFLDPGAPSN